MKLSDTVCVGEVHPPPPDISVYGLRQPDARPPTLLEDDELAELAERRHGVVAQVFYLGFFALLVSSLRLVSAAKALRPHIAGRSRKDA